MIATWKYVKWVLIIILLLSSCKVVERYPQAATPVNYETNVSIAGASPSDVSYFPVYVCAGLILLGWAIISPDYIHR
jgi:hypothetical protein